MELKELFKKAADLAKDMKTNIHEKNEPFIGFVGFGVVGKVVADSMSNCKIKIFDIKYKSDTVYKDFDFCNCLPDIVAIQDPEAIFISVPTTNRINPHLYDFEDLSNILKYLNEIKYTGYVFIKSTVLPEALKGYDNLKIIYWAEFLNDISAEADFIQETKILIGCDVLLEDQVNEFIFKYFDHINEIVFCPLDEATSFKIIKNTKSLLNIFFWETINSEFDIDQRKLRDLFEEFPFTSNYNIVNADGKPGIGGKCLPKDFSMFLEKLTGEYKLIYSGIHNFNKNKRLGDDYEDRNKFRYS